MTETEHFQRVAREKRQVTTLTRIVILGWERCYGTLSLFTGRSREIPSARGACERPQAPPGIYRPRGDLRGGRRGDGAPADRRLTSVSFEKAACFQDERFAPIQSKR